MAAKAANFINSTVEYLFKHIIVNKIFIVKLKKDDQF